MRPGTMGMGGLLPYGSRRETRPRERPATPIVPLHFGARDGNFSHCNVPARFSCSFLIFEFPVGRYSQWS